MRESERKNKLKQTKRISVAVFVTCLILAVLITFMTTYTVLGERFTASLRESYLGQDGGDGTGSITGDNEKLATIDAIYRQYYYNELDDEKLNEYILRGYVAGTGDRYGDYFTAEEYETLTADTNAEMQGIGVSVIYNTDYGLIEVINVMPESPALEAGVEPGDLIAYVGEEKESVAELGYTMARLQNAGQGGDCCGVHGVARRKL